MAHFITLTADQADRVRGPSTFTAGAALNPIERAGGIFIIGAAVLTDPAHAAHWGFLSGLPQIDSDDQSFPAEVPQ